MNKQTLRFVVLAGLFLVPFIPFLVSSSLFFPFITTKAFAWRVITEIVFAAWLLLALIDKDYRPKKSPILYAVGAFLLGMGLANLLGVDPARSFWSNFERMEGYIALLHLGAFFLVIGSVFREIEWKRWWNTSLVASTLMVFYCLFQLMGAITINQGGVRVDGTFGNASYLAVYMLIHIFIAGFFLWGGWKNKGLRYTYIALMVGQLIILYQTATRGAILGLLGGLLIVALINIRNREEKRVRKASHGIIGALVLIVGGFFLLKDTSLVTGSPVLARFATISTEELKSGGRSFVWPMALEGFKEKPFLGWGQENFVYVFQKHYSPEMHHLEPWFDRAHNIFLDWMVAGGILGLATYLSLYGITLYIIWRKDGDMSHMEKSIITGLLAAYFFHNFFVFDHLISYVLFFAIIAYVHSRNGGAALWQKDLSQTKANQIVLPALVLVLVLALYTTNLRPLGSNMNLISSFKFLQTPGKEGEATEFFSKAYNGPYLGREEVVSQWAANITQILSPQNISLEKKNEYYGLARQAILDEAERSSGYAKQQIVTGSFLLKTGFPDEALKYLLKAEELLPNKQAIKFEIGEVYINKKDYAKALEVARAAFELDPTYGDAQFTYAVVAIYAGDRDLEKKLMDVIYAGDVELENEMRKSGKVVDVERWVSSDLIITAYIRVGRYDDAISLLTRRIEREPTVAQHYVSLVSVYLEKGDRASAISTLKRISNLFPEYKVQAEAYIKQIQEGQEI